MKLSYDYEGHKIEFTVEFRNRKSLGIKVSPPRYIIVYAPVNTSRDRIIDMVKTKSKWMIKKLQELQKIQDKIVEKRLVDGEDFLYLGKTYSLQIIVGETVKKPRIELSNHKLLIHTNTKEPDAIKNILKSWYKEMAKEKILERIQYYQPYFMVQPQEVKIKDQQKRWGSCSSSGVLLFNWKLIMAPITILDYVVIHEMCHLIHMNHSKDYWGLVKKILPDYEYRKEWLKMEGVKLSL
ncbi:M48 family metallopeptidase [Alkaliphilus serpentinus]|uniref:M48 family metallopeptidase n=1 Tax=Alkaliphilus serpentinus TaxID=1482731 RepID=A0A833HMA1_9FIRM|nr:SprT family zinc-dependent metalloprotease [Alkaliphilus serpentinus]KAB3527276.1 M48 family metallopeptidase [Alkaliphilus serpentinus]